MSPAPRPQTVEVVIDLDELDVAIQTLRVSYEKYFAGVERLEPIRERDRLKALLRQLRTRPMPNTARRFRAQQLQATMVTHEQYWNRICRQIEEGTFKRDRLRAERLLRERGAAKPEAQPATPSASPAPPERPAAAPPAYPDALVRLHQAYEDTRRSLGQPQPLSIEALAKTVAKQTAALREKYACQEVEFKVVAKDGKPILKAIPKMK